MAPLNMRIRTAALGALLFATVSFCACARDLRHVDTSDPAITARARAQLKADLDINPRFLDLSTHMGIVTVSGMVDSPDQKRRINRVLSAVPGVKQVIVNIIVQE